MALAGCSTSGACFVTVPNLGGSPPGLRASAPSWSSEPRGESGVLAGLASTACTLVAAVGVVSVARRRSSAPRKALGVYAVRPEEAPTKDGSNFCGATPAKSTAMAPAKTAAQYTTQLILPALTWLKTGLKGSDLAPTELRAINLAGIDVLVGKSESGTVFSVGNLCPHLGTPMSEGADVIGDTIVCPLHGSSFNIFSGDLIDWCPTPPILGPLTGLVIEKKNLAIFECRTSFFGGDIEVQVDTNAKKAYEADYWKGILDAQGKNDGTYY